MLELDDNDQFVEGVCGDQGFFPGVTGGSDKNFVNPPIQHFFLFLDQGLSSPPPN